jgi:hypothetical protein
MPFTAEEAIRDILLVLPYRAKFLLERNGVLKFCDLLKLIDTNGNANVFTLSYPFRKL